MRRYLSAGLLVVLVLALVSCSTTPTTTTTTTTPPDSRYKDPHDFAPEHPISAQDVRDAVPRPDPILATGNFSPYEVNGVSYEILQNHRSYAEEGLASWYGAKFNGHATSNGEIYDLYQPSAAHKTLPIPCYARVTNLENGSSIVVRVNDRGPFHADRLIDLSYAAAVKLGYMERGTARVKVEVIDIAGVDDRRATVGGSYRYLQLGAFGAMSAAERLQDELQSLLNAPVFISPVDSGGGTLYRVRIGPVTDGNHLLAVQKQLQVSGYDVGQPLP